MARRRYPTDLTEGEWALLEREIPALKAGGHHVLHPRREIVNGILFALRSGGAWSLVPHDLPPWRTLSHYYRRWRRDGTWEKAQAALRRHDACPPR
jgi:putative transposase